jgi:hypothetical protein
MKKTVKVISAALVQKKLLRIGFNSRAEVDSKNGRLSEWDKLFGKDFMDELFRETRFSSKRAAKLFKGDINVLVGQADMWMLIYDKDFSPLTRQYTQTTNLKKGDIKVTDIQSPLVVVRRILGIAQEVSPKIYSQLEKQASGPFYGLGFSIKRPLRKPVFVY